MKKRLCALLCLALVAALFGCGDNGSAATTTTAATETPVLQAGFGRGCFTPKYVVQITNKGQTNYSAVYDDVYVTCIALTDADDETMLLFTCDLMTIPENQRTPLLRSVFDATGVPIENMVLSVTHDHNGPASKAVGSELKTAILEAAEQAMADRSAATLYTGTTYTQSLSFVRHYEKEDGTFTGAAHTAATTSPIKKHEDDPDNAMQLLRFDREGKKSILLMNWQCHGTLTYDTDLLNADFVGPTRRTIEEKTDCLFAYFQGAAGNISTHSWFNDLNPYSQDIGGLEQYGKALAQTAINALDSLTETNAEGIDIVHGTYTATVHQDSSEYKDAVQKFESVINAGGSTRDAVIASGDLVHGTIACSFPPKRAELGQTNDIPLMAMRLGDVGFISAPYEMFDDSGMFVKENSPFDMTVVIAYTGTHAYIPTAECIEHGCYEWECGYYEKGTAEALADEFVALLKQLPQ